MSETTRFEFRPYTPREVGEPEVRASLNNAYEAGARAALEHVKSLTIAASTKRGRLPGSDLGLGIAQGIADAILAGRA